MFLSRIINMIKPMKVVLLWIFLWSLPFIGWANTNEVQCPSINTFVGTNTTTSDFLEIGASSSASGLGFLDSTGGSGSIGINTFGSPIQFHCGIASNTPITSLGLTTSCGSDTADLTNKYVLVVDGNNNYYAILHQQYGDWDGGSGVMTAQYCDNLSGTFDSDTGCNPSLTCSASVPASTPIITEGASINVTMDEDAPPITLTINATAEFPTHNH